MTFKKKVDGMPAASTTSEVPRAARGFADVKRFYAVLSRLKTLKDELEGVEKGLGESAAEVLGIEEERRQEGATYDFNLHLKRQLELATIATEDGKREADFAERDAALVEAEDEICVALGIVRTADHIITAKEVAKALTKKIEEERKSAESKAKGVAQVDYLTQKKLDDAGVATKLALLEQENASLKSRAAVLENQNKVLLEQQQKTADTIASVAKGAFEAAGGVVAKGNEALNTAAGSGQARTR